MALIKTAEEIQKIGEGGKLLSQILDECIAMCRPGVATAEIDAHAEKRMIEVGGIPAFKGYRDREEDTPFPSTICASVNEELVHTPASERKLVDGDIFTIDIGMRYPAKDGYFTDMAKTVAIGDVPKETKKLLEVTEKSLELGIAAAKVGNRISDIGKAIQPYVEKHGYGVVRHLVGHGVGHEVHEEPRIPNYYNPRMTDMELQPGMVIAIEPMVNMGDPDIATLDDGWTIIAADKTLCAHFEHTVAITEDGPKILTLS